MCDINQAMSPTIGALAAALAKAQGTFTFAAKTSEAPVFESKERGGRAVGKRTYADLAAVIDAVRAGLAANGLAIVQAPFPQAGGGVLLRTTLMHSSGEWMASEISLPADRMGAIQGWGSALTYARRYALAAMVGIAQDDDDGQAAQDNEPRNRKAREQAQVKQARQQAKSDNPAPLSETQRKRMFAILRKLGCTKREEYLAEISAIIGRDIQSSDEVTTDDYPKIVANEPQNGLQNGDDPFAEIPDYEEAM